MQYFDGVYTSYFSLYSKYLFLERKCMHEYAFFMHNLLWMSRIYTVYLCELPVNFTPK